VRGVNLKYERRNANQDLKLMETEAAKYLPDAFSEWQSTDLKARAVKGAGANVVAQAISVVLRMAGVVFLARLLHPRDFGLVTMVNTVYLPLMNFGVNGFTEYIIQKQSISHVELNSIFWLHGFVSFFLMLCFIAAAPVLTAFYGEPRLGPIVVVMAFGIVVQVLLTSHMAILKRSMEFKKVAFNQVIAGVVSVVLAIAMAVQGWGYWAVVARQLSLPILMAVGAWIMCPWRPGFPMCPKGVMRSLRYAINVYGNFVLGYFSRNLDKVLLGRFFGPQILGAYDRAYYLSNMPAEQLITPLHSVALATLSRLRDDKKKYVNYYAKALSPLALVGVLGSVLLTVSGWDLVRVLLGPGWDQAGYVVMAFGPGVGMMIIYPTYTWIHLSLGKPERWVRWSLVEFGVTSAFILISAPFGPVYVAAAYSLSFYVLSFPAIWYAGRPIRLKIIPLGRIVGPYFASALSTWLIWLLNWKFFAATSTFLGSLSSFLRLCIVASLSSVIYVAFVVAFHRSFGPINDLISLVTIFVMKKRPPKD
jgi:O-antigen/teichoic acid export membrane protein